MYYLFSRSWSESVQIMSLVLESLGLLLAWIEVLKPALAGKITDIIYELAEFKFYTDESAREISFPWKLFICTEFITMGVVWLEISLNLTAILDFLSDPSAFISFIYKLIFIPIAVLVPIIVPLLLIRVVRGITCFLSVLSNGKPIGLMGIMLALLGMVGEIYQAIEMFVINN
jgi:hypothetical protein